MAAQFRKKVRLAYIVSHPIQYQVPLLRHIAQEPKIDLTVFFCSDHSVRGYKDHGFGGAEVNWDIPLLDGYRYEFLPALRRSSNISFGAPINLGIVQALFNGKFDAVWLHGYWSINALIAMLAAKALRIPVILRAEGSLINRTRSSTRRTARKVFFRALRPFIQAVLPIGTRSLEYWEHHLGSDMPAFKVPYAVDNSFFQRAITEARPSRETLKDQLNLLPGRPIILYASKLMPRKRCIDLIQAFLSLQPGSPGTLPYLLIVGDGSEREAIEMEVRKSRSTSVRFLGFQNQTQLGRFFDLSDLFVLPSEDEPFGLVVNEAMNAGLPVIVSDEVGCQQDLIHDGVTGRVFPARDVHALRLILEQFLESPAAFREMGRRGLDRINHWSFNEDLDGLKHALSHVAGLDPDA